jgi:hypothetical protein
MLHGPCPTHLQASCERPGSGRKVGTPSLVPPRLMTTPVRATLSRPAGEGTGARVQPTDPRLTPWATGCRPLRGLNSSTNF